MIDGSILIGDEDKWSTVVFSATNPVTGAALGPQFSEASPGDVAAACGLAAGAAEPFAAMAPVARGAFLEAIGEGLLALGEALIETAMAETGLPRARLEGERMRTVNQLRMFAAELREGAWFDVAIDRALPDRSPPRPDLRRMNCALGPVAVFGASNFPLAFSVAGGDTAAAFAAGCPVVVKGHPAHPGTGELVARVVRSAARRSGMPTGVFSYLPGRSHELGAALVADPRIKAVGFTGSRAGGLALVAIAQGRPEPIPVYAEMSSINPVVLMPHALAARSAALAAGFVGSLTLGAGQFCTNPGLVFAVEGAGLEQFIAGAVQAVRQSAPAVMLSGDIHTAYAKATSAREASAAARTIAAGEPADDGRASARLFETTAAEFAANPGLGDEVFGATSVVVRCHDLDELAEALASLEGQLTATIHLDAADEDDVGAILAVMRDKAGRVLANGWPTGVEVSRAMVHGGPFPATSDSRSTSVGTLAMMRFLRPVCWQDIPAALLPAPIRDDNPWMVPQRIS